MPHRDRAGATPTRSVLQLPLARPQLEDYLSELESITISFEDGRTLDFAEGAPPRAPVCCTTDRLPLDVLSLAAALLIQGSACIYSKKVEHLYTLVYQTLNQVVEEKKK